MQADLRAAKDVVNTEAIEDLLCFVFNDGVGDKVFWRLTDFSGIETFLIDIFR